MLGNSELVSQNLETGNSSVNQTLPELTIAQKAFTANVKIISVGNTLQDDLNQLIR
ncbi:flagellar hook protein FlgE [compost metagenome]